MLDVEHVDFVSIPTRDLARTRQFYEDLLGLPPSSLNRDEFETPNLTLALWQPDAEGVPFAPNTAGIALRVRDVEAARRHLIAHGVEFLGKTVDTGVCLMGVFYDPDGNVLILASAIRSALVVRAPVRLERGESVASRRLSRGFHAPHADVGSSTRDAAPHVRGMRASAVGSPGA